MLLVATTQCHSDSANFRCNPDNAKRYVDGVPTQALTITSFAVIVRQHDVSKSDIVM